jgi:hypothetical protein
MIDRIRTWAAIIGMTMIGPIFLGFYVVCLLKGEFPFRHSTLRAAEHPFFFYLLIVPLLYAGFKITQISIMFAIGYFRGRSRH